MGALLYAEAADVILDTVAPCTGLIWIVSLSSTNLHENHLRSIPMICLGKDPAEKGQNVSVDAFSFSLNLIFTALLYLRQLKSNGCATFDGN